MIKFDVLNRYSGAVQFTAEIDCNDNERTSIKLGLAVKWALLNRASLVGANLVGASLVWANLVGANLDGASLDGANLVGANLVGVIGNKKQIKSMQLDTYSITYTADRLQIGCKNHAISDWWSFTEEQIAEMDGGKSLKWWKRWKDKLREIIEFSPAVSTGKESEL